VIALEMALFRLVPKFSGIYRAFSKRSRTRRTIDQILEPIEAFQELTAHLDMPEKIEPRPEISDMDLNIIAYNPDTQDYENTVINSKAQYMEKRVLFIGIIGAFVPECTCEVVYEWAKAAKAFKIVLEVDEITVVSKNDPFVMQNFARKLGYEDRLNFLADWNGEFNKIMKSQRDFELELGTRNFRYVAYMNYGVLKCVFSSYWSEMFFTSSVEPGFIWRKMISPQENALFYC
jgi:peroxiredoxin